MSSPVIALLTDFGTRDPYVAAMKAVIASRCEAQVLDLTHDVPPYDVAEAAFFLQFVAADLQRRPFIVVAVVDPGVGTDRRILALHCDDAVFLAPDNGLVSLLIHDDCDIRSVENSALFRSNGSNTFHGRDRFAPVAAALAAGLTTFQELGPVIDRESVVRLPYRIPVETGRINRGSVIAIDRFGNIISDLPADAMTAGASLLVKGRQISAISRSYEEGRNVSGPFMIVGSRGTIEISIANGSAADLLQIARFDPVELRRHT